MKLQTLVTETGKKIVMFVIALFVIAASYQFFLQVLNVYPELSGLPYALTKGLMGVVTLRLIDELMLYEVPTMILLKKDAKGYAIYIAAYALIIALAFANA